jgi:hypothetical protein
MPALVKRTKTRECGHQDDCQKDDREVDGADLQRSQADEGAEIGGHDEVSRLGGDRHDAQVLDDDRDRERGYEPGHLRRPAHRTEGDALDQHADRRADDQHDDDGHRKRRVKGCDARQHCKGANRYDVTMGEIDQPHDPVDQ